jgi:DNA-binding NarL/FixJ family response regulator
MIRLACEDTTDLEVAGEAGDGSEAARLIDELEPDVVVLDLVMPAVDGFEVLRGLRDARFQPRVLVVSAHGDHDAVFECLRLGAAGFLDKTAPVEQLVAAIRAVGAGTDVFSVEHIRQAQARLGDMARRARAATDAHGLLTPREREVLDLIAGGLTSRQIASRLRVSERTIESHVTNLYRKLDVRTRVQAVHRAASLGLLDLGG